MNRLLRADSVRAEAPAPPQIRHESYDERMRRWEAAQTTRLNNGHWSWVTGLPINAELASKQTNLRDRSEYEIANNPLVEGMINTYTLSCIGPHGPTLRIMTKDRDYNAQRQAIWNSWQKNAASNQQLGLVDIMRQWVRALFGCGEYVDQIISISDVPGPVKMRLLPIHAHRLLTPPEFLGDHEVALGVRRDLKNRRPVAYYISQPYIFGAFEVYTGEFLEIPFRDLLHGFLMLEEDQVRGVPWLASCLDPIAELRDYKASTLDAARAAADWGVYLYTQHPEAQFFPNNEVQNFERRQTRHVPPGWQPFQVQAQQPPPQWEMFYDSLVREIGRPVNMPLMMMLLDSSGHNYSSARFDGQLFWQGIGYTQGFFGRSLDRLESEVALEAEMAGALPPPPAGVVARRWLWNKPPHVDPTKEELADRTAMENGHLSFTELCAKHNKDPEHVIAERTADNERLAEAGLPTIPGIPEQVGRAEAEDDGWNNDAKPTRANQRRPSPAARQPINRVNGHGPTIAPSKS